MSADVCGSYISMLMGAYRGFSEPESVESTDIRLHLQNNSDQIPEIGALSLMALAKTQLRITVARPIPCSCESQLLGRSHVPDAHQRDAGKSQH